MMIAVATSIPPTMVREEFGVPINYDYQKVCIQSWVDCGFRVLSVNAPEEIPDLIAKYPEVTFIPITRNASAWTGRKNPFVADLLLALIDAAEPALGIINSDLLFEPSAAWAEKLPLAVTESMVVAHRYDTRSLLKGVLRPFDGIDCFFFDRAIAVKALEDAMPFAMGVPWWDYWLPCVALSNGRKITFVGRPAVLHLVHKQGYSWTMWREFAGFFARSVVRRFDNASLPLPSNISVIISGCREIAACPIDATPSEFKRLTRAFGKVFMPSVRQETVTWDERGRELVEPTAPAVTANNIFRHFEKRYSAGKALIKARRLARENRWADIGLELVAAMDEAREDANILLMLGEIALHRGDLQSAHSLIALAVERRPESELLRRKFNLVLNVMAESNEPAQAQTGMQKLFLQIKSSYIGRLVSRLRTY
jgi:hypothetical protein